MDLSGLLEITPVGLGTTIMCLALLAALGISKRGKRLIRASRTAHAPLGFVCILVSLVLVLVGTLILYAHKAVCQSSWWYCCLSSSLTSSSSWGYPINRRL
jgi:hypothetical protein